MRASSPKAAITPERGKRIERSIAAVEMDGIAATAFKTRHTT